MVCVTGLRSSVPVFPVASLMLGNFARRASVLDALDPLVAADASGGGNPPPQASTEAPSPPLPHERRTSRLPLLPSGPCGVQRAKGVSGALQLRLTHRRPRGTRAHRYAPASACGFENRPPDFGPRISTVSGYRGRRTPRPSPPPFKLPTADYIKVWLPIETLSE